MGKLIYTLVIKLYTGLIHVLAFMNPKARAWVEGRKDIFLKMEQAFQNNTAKIAWFHCASLGEFEQGRPVIENFKKEFPEFKTLLTFFSPSGYEIRKNYKGADFIFYLPADQKKNAARFLLITKPDIAFFVKYEFWYFYIKELKLNHIPLLSISAIFRENQFFFNRFGGFYRKILRMVDHFFVQDEKSKYLLDSINIKSVTISGDTRFDRVKAISDEKKDLALIENFKGDHLLLVVGSSWAQDMEIVLPVLNKLDLKIKIVIAPHEIDENEINLQKNKLVLKSINFSQAAINNISDYQVLFIDNIGMLSYLYRYADIAYIGGGFGKGIHNTLEAAAFGMPIIFGPKHEKFQEAMEMVAMKCAYVVHNKEEFSKILAKLITDHQLRKNAASISANYVREKTGATSTIIEYCKKILIKETV